ncbi:major facilitator superfamily transporter, partial [Fusarium albosuccineum]
MPATPQMPSAQPEPLMAGNNALEVADEQNEYSEGSSTLQEADAEKAGLTAFPGSDAPDGGLTAWLVVLGAWCTSFCSFGWLTSECRPFDPRGIETYLVDLTPGVGIFQEYYQNQSLSNYSSGTIAWIPSLQIFFMMGMGPIVGVLYDNFGPRKLLLAGSLLHVFGIMMTSLSTEYYQILLSQGVCSAIGVSALFQPPLNCIHGWFNQRRGAAFGILSTGSSIGGVIFPIMVTHLIRTVGYGWAMRICAFLILALLIIANLTVRARHPSRPQKVSGARMRKPFTEADFLLLTAGFFCFTFGNFVPINYLPTQARAAGMDENLVQYLIPILNAASLFGRLFSGLIGNRIGKYNIFTIVCYLAGIWILALWIPDVSDPALIAFAVLFGFCSGAYVSLIAPLVMQISPMSEIGLRTGLIFFAASFPGLTTNPARDSPKASNTDIAGLQHPTSMHYDRGSMFGKRLRKGKMLFKRKEELDNPNVVPDGTIMSTQPDPAANNFENDTETREEGLVGANNTADQEVVYPSGVKLALLMISVFVSMFLVAL